jgi:exosortase
VFRDLARDLWESEDNSHGFLVPVFVTFVLWHERSRYRPVPQAPSGLGLAINLFSLTLLIGGTLGADYFTARFSLCTLLAGIVVYLSGWKMLRAVAFPLAYLALMIPLPNIIHNQITFPMQLLASRIAETLISLTGVPVFREGNLLRVPFYSVEVVQACSGIRSLLSLVALGAAYAYAAETRSWLRVMLVILMLPIAIFTNAVRIMSACLLGYKVGPEWAEGFVHLFSGWLIFVVALTLLYFIHSSISHYAQRKTSHV